MAQGRVVYPDFWTDAKMTKLSITARLFYIGTWNFAYCDKGHLVDDADELKLKILPSDVVDAESLLGELLAMGRVVRDTLPDGGTYLTVSKLGVHQRKDDPRWNRRCPICKALETTQDHSRGLRRGDGVERSEVGGSTRGARPPRYCPQHPNGTDGGCFKCRDARIAQQAWDEAQKRDQKAAPDLRRPRKGDGHECVDDGYGWCSKCGEKSA